jgi:hypothetical protein
VVVVVVAGGDVVVVVEWGPPPPPPPAVVVVVTGWLVVVVVRATVVVVVELGNVVGIVTTGALGKLAAYATMAPEEAAAAKKVTCETRRTRAKRRSRCAVVCLAVMELLSSIHCAGTP